MTRDDPTTTLLSNGRFHRDAHDADPASALLVEGRRIAWIGEERDAPPHGRRIDLRGASVLPGLTDAHIHVFALALARTLVSFAAGAPRCIADILAIARREEDRLTEGEWLQGLDLNEDALAEGRLPTRGELDAAFPDRPVLLRRYCGHAAIFNTAAQHRLRLDQHEPDPEFGHFSRTPDGALAGAAFERAAESLFRAAPSPPQARLRPAMEAVFADCLGLGLTAITEAAVGFSIGYDAEAELWERLREDGAVPLRVGLMAQLTASEAAARGLRPVWDERWSRETLKFFADGIVGGRTSAMSEPFCDRGGTGGFVLPEDVLAAQIAEADAAGWRIGVHATGDRAIELVAQAYERAADPQRGPRRHRIEHCFCPPAGLFERLAPIDALVVMQPSFLARMGRSIEAALGERTRSAYPARSVLNAKARLVFSSDAPTGFLSPWAGVLSAVDRASPTGARIGPDEAVDVRAAIAAYVGGGAFAMRHEGFRGRLAPGLAADLTVLDRDPFERKGSALAETRSLLTMIDGATVHCML